MAKFFRSPDFPITGSPDLGALRAPPLPPIPHLGFQSTYINASQGYPSHCLGSVSYVLISGKVCPTPSRVIPDWRRLHGVSSQVIPDWPRVDLPLCSFVSFVVEGVCYLLFANC